jgi:hypothetical protein
MLQEHPSYQKNCSIIWPKEWAKSWTSWAAACSTELLGALKVTGIVRSMGLINSGFHMQKNFSASYLHFGYALSKILPALPCTKKV